MTAQGTEVKLFEVRDEGTQMPCMVTAVCRAHTDHEGKDDWLMYRAGWGEEYVGLYFAVMCPEANDYAISFVGAPYVHTWSRRQTSRMLIEAWNWVSRHYDKLRSGDVVDVQFILGERREPRQSGWVAYDERRRGVA